MRAGGGGGAGGGGIKEKAFFLLSGAAGRRGGEVMGSLGGSGKRKVSPQESLPVKAILHPPAADTPTADQRGRSVSLWNRIASVLSDCKPAALHFRTFTSVSEGRKRPSLCVYIYTYINVCVYT